MQDITQLDEGDEIQYTVGDDKTVRAEITDKYTATKGSTLTGDKRDVLTFKVDVISDNVYEDTDIVDEEMFEDGTEQVA